jgi:anti-sigma B factor antagonist
MPSLRHPLSIDLIRSGDAVVVVAHGYVDLSTRLKFSTALNDAVTLSQGHVVVDLTEVGFLDSTGLGVLVSGDRRLTHQRRRLLIVCPPGPARRVFELSALDGALDLHHDRAAALASVGNGVPSR